MRLPPSALLLLVLCSAPGARAETAPARAVEAPSPAAADKLRHLLDLAADPEVRSTPGPLSCPISKETTAGGLGGHFQTLRARLGELMLTVPRLPGEASHGRDMLGDMPSRGGAWTIGPFMMLFVAPAFGGEAVYRANMQPFHHWLLALPLETARERVSAVFARLAYEIGLVAAFAVASVGAMLPFDRSTAFKEVLLTLLLAAVATRLAAVAGRFLLAPGAPRFRVVPIGTAKALFLHRRAVVAGLLLGTGSQLPTLLSVLCFDAPSVWPCADAVGALALALGLDAALRFLRAASEPGPAPTHAEWRRLRARALRAVLAGTLVLLWLCEAAGADRAFWLRLFAVGGPCAVAVTQRSVHHVMRPAGFGDGGAGRASARGRVPRARDTHPDDRRRRGPPGASDRPRCRDADDARRHVDAGHARGDRGDRGRAGRRLP